MDVALLVHAVLAGELLVVPVLDVAQLAHVPVVLGLAPALVGGAAVAVAVVTAPVIPAVVASIVPIAAVGGAASLLLALQFGLAPLEALPGVRRLAHRAVIAVGPRARFVPPPFGVALLPRLRVAALVGVALPTCSAGEVFVALLQPRPRLAALRVPALRVTAPRFVTPCFVPPRVATRRIRALSGQPAPRLLRGRPLAIHVLPLRLPLAVRVPVLRLSLLVPLPLPIAAVVVALRAALAAVVAQARALLGVRGGGDGRDQRQEEREQGGGSMQGHGGAPVGYACTSALDGLTGSENPPRGPPPFSWRAPWRAAGP